MGSRTGWREAATAQIQGIGIFPIQGFFQSISTEQAAATRGAGVIHPVFGPAIIVKEMDVNTPILFSYAATGKMIVEVTLDFFRYPEDLPTLQKYMTVKLQSVQVVALSEKEESRAVSKEEIKLDFEIIKWITPDGTERGWNVKLNKPL